MLNNQDFARLRAKSLGGSDIGAILGFSRYRSAVDVWLEKTGRTTHTADSLPLRFGNFAEAFVADEYARATGFSLVHHESAFIHPQYPYMHGHIDRFICDSSSLINESGELQATRLLECKTANPFASREWGEIGSDQVPMAYLAQCLWYLAITGLEQADLAVLMGNTDFRIYEIKRDHELEAIIIERARQFWENHVLTDLAPPPQTEADCKVLYPKSNASKTVEAKPGTCELITQLKSLQAQIEIHETQISRIKQVVMNEMQDAEVLRYQGQILATWKAPKPSVRIDTKKLAIDHPEMIAAYQTEVINSRRLIIKEISQEV